MRLNSFCDCCKTDVNPIDERIRPYYIALNIMQIHEGSIDKLPDGVMLCYGCFQAFRQDYNSLISKFYKVRANENTMRQM